MKARLPRALSFPVPLWLCGLGVLVAWLGGSISEYDAAKQLQQQPDRSASAEARPTLTVTEKITESPGATGASATPSEGASGIASAAVLAPGLGRLEAFQNALRGINASNWQEVAEAVHRAQKEGLIAQLEETWIYERIGEVAGPLAIKFFEPEDMNSPDLRRGGLSTLRGWASQDRDAAWAYVESLPVSYYRSAETAGLIRAVAEKDPALARRALESMTPEGQANFFAIEAKSGVPGAYARLAEDWLKESSPTDDEGKGLAVQSSVFGNLVRLRMAKGSEYAGGEDMAGWLASYAGKPFAVNPAVQWAIRAQSKADPVRAMALVETLVPPDQPVSTPASWNIVADSVAMLIASDPDAGLRWITERRESPSYGPAVYAWIAEQGAGMDDATVQTWLETVDAQTRNRIAQLRARQKASPPGTNLSLSGQIRGQPALAR